MSDKLKTQDRSWKTPNEIIRLQRLKQKQKALQARIERPAQNAKASLTDGIFGSAASKRKNPFADKRISSNAKKSRLNEIDISEVTDINSEDSIFNLLAASSNNTSPDEITEKSNSNNKKPLISKDLQSFTNLIVPNGDITSDNDDAEELQKPTSHVPVDWGLKTKLRILSTVNIPGSRLKSNEEASGITGFVRCIDLKSSETGLDISPASRFHQSTMYWQHPSLPWLTMFPRMSKANIGFTLGEPERAALARDWADSFRALFQLVRALQCPYFYFCANSFTVLFRAAGIGGRVETHALLTPTTRGLRAALKEEDIEFCMPLKRSSTENQNKSLDSGNDTQSNSFSNMSEDIADTSKENISGNGDEGVAENEDSEEEDEEQWLASLGVEASEIKKISTLQARRKHNDECAEDSTDQSILLIEGVECQALFNFLLNAKSTITKVGRLAGVPPTLLAPVAFPGATLQNVQIRASTVRMDNIDYYSMEMKGVILPHVLQYLCGLLKETKDQFSATMVNFPSTNALSKAAQRLIDDLNKENQEVASENVFGRENLSDSGMLPQILEALCRTGPDAIRNLERMCYNKSNGGYTWT